MAINIGKNPEIKIVVEPNNEPCFIEHPLFLKLS